jgi:hypothetical protein
MLSIKGSFIAKQDYAIMQRALDSRNRQQKP